MESTKTRPNKNGRKRYLFWCFKPDDVIDPPRRRENTTDPLLTYITLAEKQGIVLPAILSSALTVAKGGAGEGGASRRRKIGNDGYLRIRQALIAALNHTSLGKKIIKRRKINKSTRYISRINKLGGEGDNNNIISNKEPKIPDKTNSDTSTSHSSPALTPSTSSSSSSCSTSSETTQASAPSSELNPTSQNQDVRDSRKGHFGSNIAMCVLFLTSLLVLIFWGKFCAILCSSVGFLVVPLRRRRHCNDEGIFGQSTEHDSVKYKKKFTMEGLLRRRKL